MLPLSASSVLTAAVTQASLQSMLHKILTGPSAFNITTILSQAAQLSNQGKQTVPGPPQVLGVHSRSVFSSVFFSHGLYVLVIVMKWVMYGSYGVTHIVVIKLGIDCVPFLFITSSSAIEPVTYVVNIGCLVAQVLCFSQNQHAADQRWSPEAPPQHAVSHLTGKSKAMYS